MGMGRVTVSEVQNSGYMPRAAFRHLSGHWT